MSNNKVKPIPYGLANYERLVQKNGYYVDKTSYLKEIEDAGDYLFFIRPRRFGKSLFLSMMEAYYDVFYKDRFKELFKDKEIYCKPTNERSTYLVLTFNFSAVDPEGENIDISFVNHVRGRALAFLRKYPDYLPADREYFKKVIEQSRSAADILSTITDLFKDSGQKLYVMIDEYDNFANTILSTSGESAYRDLTHGKGFFRAFFNVLKSGASGMGAPITRLFITGVSPITLDDVTSGFNIGKNVSIEPHFNCMLGFTRDDVIEMIEYYKNKGLIKHDTNNLAAIMDEWYGHYLFSESEDIRVFNSDMVLYFIDNYLTNNDIPKDLIDRNTRIDYGKLRYLILVDRGRGKTTNGNFERLKEILGQGEIPVRLKKGFPLEKITDEDNFVSLLFYFGLLTIKKAELDEVILTIPNETVRRLYYDYIREAYEETDIFSIDLSTYSRLMNGMAVNGEWQPLLDYLTGRMRESMGLRDLISGEKSIQAFLNVYLGLSNLYIIYSEKELNKGFADIVMEPFLARYEGIKYSYILEIKYIKAGKKTGKVRLEQIKSEAEEQLERYSFDEKFAKSIRKTTLIKIVLIFSGHEAIYMGTV